MRTLERFLYVQNRTHEQSGRGVRIANTSCRIVSFDTLRSELKRNDLRIIKDGTTSAPPDFPMLMYIVAGI